MLAEQYPLERSMLWTANEYAQPQQKDVTHMR